MAESSGKKRPTKRLENLNAAKAFCKENNYALVFSTKDTRPGKGYLFRFLPHAKDNLSKLEADRVLWKNPKFYPDEPNDEPQSAAVSSNAPSQSTETAPDQYDRVIARVLQQAASHSPQIASKTPTAKPRGRPPKPVAKAAQLKRRQSANSGDQTSTAAKKRKMAIMIKRRTASAKTGAKKRALSSLHLRVSNGAHVDDQLAQAGAQTVAADPLENASRQPANTADNSPENEPASSANNQPSPASGQNRNSALRVPLSTTHVQPNVDLLEDTDDDYEPPAKRNKRKKKEKKGKKKSRRSHKKKKGKTAVDTSASEDGDSGSENAMEPSEAAMRPKSRGDAKHPPADPAVVQQIFPNGPPAIPDARGLADDDDVAIAENNAHVEQPAQQPLVNGEAANTAAVTAQSTESLPLDNRRARRHATVSEVLDDDRERSTLANLVNEFINPDRQSVAFPSFMKATREWLTADPATRGAQPLLTTKEFNRRITTAEVNFLDYLQNSCSPAFALALTLRLYRVAVSFQPLRDQLNHLGYPYYQRKEAPGDAVLVNAPQRQPKQSGARRVSSAGASKRASAASVSAPIKPIASSKATLRANLGKVFRPADSLLLRDPLILSIDGEGHQFDPWEKFGVTTVDLNDSEGGRSSEIDPLDVPGHIARYA